jgi:chemotaxis signal transduction protein
MLVTNGGTAFAVSDVREVLHIESGIQESPVESELTEGVYLRGQDVLPVVDIEKIAKKL